MAKNLIPEICKMLGVEIGEEFKVEGVADKTYKFIIDELIVCGEEAAMKELMGMMTEAAQRYCEATKGDEKCEVLN